MLTIMRVQTSKQQIHMLCIATCAESNSLTVLPARQPDSFSKRYLRLVLIVPFEELHSAALLFIALPFLGLSL